MHIHAAEIWIRWILGRQWYGSTLMRKNTLVQVREVVIGETAVLRAIGPSVVRSARYRMHLDCLGEFRVYQTKANETLNGPVGTA